MWRLGSPSCPCDRPGCCVAVERDGSAGSLLAALGVGRLVVGREEQLSCTGFPQPSKERARIVDLRCWCYMTKIQ